MKPTLDDKMFLVKTIPGQTGSTARGGGVRSLLL